MKVQSQILVSSERAGKLPLDNGARIWKITWHVAAILAGLVGVFYLVVVPWFLTSLVTTSRFHFPDPNDGKSPKSYGLNFQGVEFRSLDGILLKGWYVPATGRARGTIVYAHGHNRTRVEMLPEAAFVHGLGYNGLVFDLRHQGASDGDLTTVGYNERKDLQGAVRFVLNEEKATRPVILWGISMGAAAALLAAAESPDVDAVISDSTFLSFSDMVRHHWKLFFRLPSFPVADQVIYWTAWRGGFRPADFDLVTAVERIGDRPILFVAMEDDRRMPPSIAHTLFERAKSAQKQLVVVPGNRHGEGYNVARERYQQAVREFLGHLANGPRN